MAKDRERIMCNLIIKRAVTQYVIHKDVKCTVAHRLLHFAHCLAWEKKKVHSLDDENCITHVYMCQVNNILKFKMDFHRLCLMTVMQSCF